MYLVVSIRLIRSIYTINNVFALFVNVVAKCFFSCKTFRGAAIVGACTSSVFPEQTAQLGTVLYGSGDEWK